MQRAYVRSGLFHQRHNYGNIHVRRESVLDEMEKCTRMWETFYESMKSQCRD